MSAWKYFLRRIRNASDEFIVTVVLAVILGSAILFLNLVVRGPDWPGIQTELHGVFVEVVLIALIAATWLRFRERRQWRAGRPVLSARMFAACNFAAEGLVGTGTKTGFMPSILWKFILLLSSNSFGLHSKTMLMCQLSLTNQIYPR